MRALWREGFSAERIAQKMGDGFTRNSVLGKIHRIGFQADKRGINNNPITKAERAMRNAGRRVAVAELFNARARALAEVRSVPKPKPEPAAKPKDAPEPGDTFGDRIDPLPDWNDETDAGGVAIFDLQPHHCRWPAWSHGEKSGLFCGNRRVEPLSYCIGHARIAYRPADSRERRLSTYLPRNQGA